MNLICGINPVVEALHAGTRHFERLLVVKGLRNRRINEALAAASRLGVPLRFESRDTLDRLSSGVPHQGLIAVVSAKPVLDLEALLAQTRDPALLVVLDGVEDPRNLGAILRTAEAAGADGVLLPERHSAGLSETVARASAGGLEHVRVARVGNLAQTLEALKARGIWTVGFDAAGRERWDAVDLKRPVALVLGGEGRGMRRLVREKCDHLVALPLFGHVSSLNVSVAAGIALYEAIRQRGLVPSHVRPIPARPATGDDGIVGPRPDDAEQDPGHFAPRLAGEAELGGDADAGGLDDADVVPLQDEELAWGTGPTIVHGGVHRRGRWGREGGPRERRRLKGRKRQREGGRPDRPPAPGGGEAPPPPAPAVAGDGHEELRRRKKRRRRGRGRPEGQAPGFTPPPPRPEAGAGSPGPAPEGGPGPRRGRRRRRGRRPGPPPGGAPA